jgi:N-acetyl-anhydromuramyl-L-alanine amidase AmpD
MRRRTDYIVVHCSATRPHQDVGAAEIRRDHKALGWTDIGYHRVIRRDGRIESGRPVLAIGSHAKGFNARSIAVCLVGGLDMGLKPANNFTPAQMRSLRELVAAWKRQWPNAEVLGHRDLFGDTNKDGVIDRRDWLKECPCFDVREWWAGTPEGRGTARTPAAP